MFEPELPAATPTGEMVVGAGGGVTIVDPASVEKVALGDALDVPAAAVERTSKL